MKIKVISDLHTCWWGHQTNKEKFKRILNHVLPPQEGDKDCVLVCAGDMGKFHNSYDNTLKILYKELSKRFQHVITTSGNHEYYSSSGIWGHEEEYWKDRTKLPDNVHFLDNDFKVIEGVMFIGSCLWTNCNNRDPVVMYHTEKGMNDYVQIKKGEGAYGAIRLTSEDTVERHEASVKFILDALKIAKKENFKPVIVTHHAPSVKSVHKKYAGDLVNFAFYSDLEWITDLFNIPLWVHGHTHNSFDYSIDYTRVVCNPFGYIGTMDQNPEFNTNLIVKV